VSSSWWHGLPVQHTPCHIHMVSTVTQHATKIWQCTLDRWDTPPATRQDDKYHVRVQYAQHAQLFMDCLVKTTMTIRFNPSTFNTDTGLKITHSWCLATNILQQDIAIKFLSRRRNNNTYQPVVISLSTTYCHNCLSSCEQSEEKNSGLQDRSVEGKCWTWTPHW
jgi:hypothetical protein